MVSLFVDEIFLEYIVKETNIYAVETITRIKMLYWFAVTYSDN